MTLLTPQYDNSLSGFVSSDDHLYQTESSVTSKLYQSQEPAMWSELFKSKYKLLSITDIGQNSCYMFIFQNIFFKKEKKITCVYQVM